ncbi:MAG TPA: response regulator [Geminicoccaceae bacterium]|nr:response regulator [Geminicoccaceae bacterium]
MDSPLSGRRVLVVEDELIVAFLLEDMLAGLGCAVVGPAARVDQALALLDAEAIDAALLDVNLNGHKSYPVADALAARGVPFVFSTAYHTDRPKWRRIGRYHMPASEIHPRCAAVPPAIAPGRHGTRSLTRYPQAPVARPPFVPAGSSRPGGRPGPTTGWVEILDPAP